MKKILASLLLPAIIFSLTDCSKKKEALFEAHYSNETKINFSNKLTPNDSINPFTFTNFYNGGGVGIGDVNNDGKADIFFGGNQVSCRLYLSKIDTLNKKWEFEDITEMAGVKTDRWCTGISMVDINQDGLLDIYVSVAKHTRMRNSENLLFVNQGIGKGKIPVFKEMAKDYGLDDNSFTVQTAFFDADLDGDLDAYLMNSAPDLQNPNYLRQTYNDGSYPSTGKLYLNEGSGKNGLPVYTNISGEAGVKYEGLGLGLAISDLNKDGFPDIYCSNDFISSDILYLNSGLTKNKKPAFGNVIKQATAHTSLYGMGLDIADINNDTYPDIIQLDMLPEDNFRQKKMLAGQDYDRKEMSISPQYDYQLQYMRNMLQLNLGNISGQNKKANSLVFSEIGLLAGIAKTDWSWAPLIADYDNDGWKDVFITNGYRRDVTDRDFILYKEDFSNFGTNNFKQQNALELIEKVPEVKIANYAYRNSGDLTFANVSENWGLNELSYSNGAAYADLDGDGDLDMVVNNIDSEAFVYQNTASEKGNGNYLNITLKGEKGNLQGIGSKVTIWAGGTVQYSELSVVRSFQSSVDPMLHFGTGNKKFIDSIEVIWPGGMSQKLSKIPVNQRLVISKKNASLLEKPQEKSVQQTYFTDITDEVNIDFNHTASGFVDFKQTAALHKMLSKNGFPMAVADVNNDGLDDIFVGGSYLKGKPTLLLQQTSGKFKKQIIAQDSLHENVAGIFFDADGDKDVDLFIVNGGNQLPVSDKSYYTSQLYLNDGKGNFQLAPAGTLPDFSLSGSCIASNDFDKDGDQDLFIGGRMIPGKYPLPARSYLLRNDTMNGIAKFTDVTRQFCPGLLQAGLVCTALWADTNGDGFDDLVLAGEWMPVNIYESKKGKSFQIASLQNGLRLHTGWWNNLAAADFDKDGDVDFIAGNEGLNTFYRASEKEPMKIVAKDFNNDGVFDPLMGYFIQGVRYPSVPRDALNQQVIQFRRKFAHYADYAKVSFEELLNSEEKRRLIRPKLPHSGAPISKIWVMEISKCILCLLRHRKLRYLVLQ
ncbi:VCBS repeat-containing protein [Dyadobacter sp. NIV53]|uniref:VCBS repeat-containing protein n=1 Tax=Dyadobacter sp. NIV53 TaxID=2861765 RepID=UPI001C86A221|nr:VCBS repeat-containing protein [Dyadobacter sp. NIV53]